MKTYKYHRSVLITCQSIFDIIKHKERHHLINPFDIHQFAIFLGYYYLDVDFVFSLLDVNQINVRQKYFYLFDENKNIAFKAQSGSMGKSLHMCSQYLSYPDSTANYEMINRKKFPNAA
jgi:hypothetical protein